MGIIDYAQKINPARLFVKEPPPPMTSEFGVVYNWQQYAFPGFYPSNPDDLVITKQLAVYDDMLKDATVRATVNIKKFAVVGADWDILPFNNEDDALEMAEFVRWVFEHVKGSVTQVFVGILDALAKGFSISEIMWGIVLFGDYKDKWTIEALKPKDPKDYEFDLDKFGNVTQILLKTMECPTGSDNPVPPEKFIHYSYNPRYGEPWGQSDLRAIYKHWWSKDWLVKFWNIYQESYGMAPRFAKVPRSTAPSEITKMKKIMRDFMNNSAVVIPDDITIEFHDAAKGGWEGFRTAIQYHNTEIIRGILGATLTAGEGERVGSMALGKVHENTQETFIEYLRVDLEDLINEQIIRRIVEHNYLDVKGYPYFVFRPRKQQVQITNVADIQILLQSGILETADFKWLRERLELPPLDVTEAEEDMEGDGEVDTEPTEIPADEPMPGTEDEPGETEAEPEIEAKEIDWKATAAGYAMSRKPLPAERRVDFVRMDTDMLGDADILRARLSDVVEGMRDRMMRDVADAMKNGKVNTDKVMGLRLIGLKDFSNALIQSFDGIVQKQSRIAYGEVGISKDEYENFAVIEISAEARPPVVELARLKKWKLEGDQKKIREWRRGRLDDLQARNKYNAFYITDIEKNHILSKVRSKIFNGMENGLSTPEMMNGVKGVFEKYIARGDVTNKALAEAPRIETIVRTNTTKLYAQTRKMAFQDPLIMDDFPGMMFSAILDDRTTEQCANLDGKIYAADDPVWGNITPPLQYNCRSTLVAVYKDDMPESFDKKPNMNLIPEDFGGTG